MDSDWKVKTAILMLKCKMTKEEALGAGVALVAHLVAGRHVARRRHGEAATADLAERVDDHVLASTREHNAHTLLLCHLE